MITLVHCWWVQLLRKNSMEILQNSKNRTTKSPSIPTSGYRAQGDEPMTLKRHLHYRSIIYNTKTWKPPELPPADDWINKPWHLIQP